MYPNLWIIVPAFVVGVTSRFEHSTRERHRHTITSCLNVLCCDGFCSRCNILMERTLLMHSVCCWFSESFCVIVGAQENNYFSLPFFCADCRYKGTHTEMFHFHLLSGLTCCSSFFFFLSPRLLNLPNAHLIQSWTFRMCCSVISCCVSFISEGEPEGPNDLRPLAEISISNFTLKITTPTDHSDT